MPRYWAHSDPDGLPDSHPDARWQPLRTHLTEVAGLAWSLARECRPADTPFHNLARAAGLLHDYGKFTPEFQQLIRGELGRRVPHAALGAAIARSRAECYEVAFAVCGHHGGLPDSNAGPASLIPRANAAQPAADRLWLQATEDCPELAECTNLPNPLLTRTSRRHPDLLIRMLYSCLVDADRLNTAAFYGTPQPAPASLDPERRLSRLLEYVQKRAAGVPEGAVKSARQAVLQSCLSAASHPSRLFSLTVPTGGAKTLASMAFALQRAALFPDRFRRIIVVIPYLSIIEQNAQVFIDAVGADAVLEHHTGEPHLPDAEDPSGEDYTNPALQVATENWDAPIIVTTSVRFFDSLFSRRPSDLRRIHNIARSIVILDEVQTLPRRILAPVLTLLDELARDWDTTFLFCTATQPAFEKADSSDPKDRRWPAGKIQEVIPCPADLFSKLRRVSVSWPDSKSAWPDIAARMAAAGRALCIVNTRRQALDLFTELCTLCEPESVFHLSTSMCPRHRLDVLQAIRRRLCQPDLPCLVASTQLVEAGVDLDFPVVFRAMGPLDSLAQAAGRCDREGLLTAAAGAPAGRLVVFEPEDAGMPPGVYSEAAELTRALRLSTDNPDHIRTYFHRLYSDADTGMEIELAREKLKFSEVARECRLIPDDTVPVYVPYDQAARALIAELRSCGILHLQLRRSLQRYAVNLRPWEILEARKGPVCEVRPDSGVWVCVEGFYDHRAGFCLKALQMPPSI